MFVILGREEEKIKHLFVKMFRIDRVGANRCDGCYEAKPPERLVDVEIESIDCWRDVTDVMAAGFRRILLYGPPGTGKTYAALRLGLTGGPAERLVCTEDLTTAEITGSWMPVNSGRWEWREGPAIRAWRQNSNGGRLVVDEVDRASGDALSTLLAVTDSAESARWRNPETGEWVRPGSEFSVVMTTNLADLSSIPTALRDRFPIAIRIDQPHVSAVKLLSPDLQEPARSSSLGEQARRISLRQWYAFDILRTSLGAERTAQLIFGPETSQDVLDALRVGSMR